MKNFSQVTNNLFRGSAPNIKDIFNLKNFGIKRIVSLDEKFGKLISKTCKELKIEQKIIPLDGTRKSLIKLFENNLHDLFLTIPTFVHCRYGEDRTGFLIAYLSCKYLNKSFDEALKEAKSFGFGNKISLEVKKMYEKIIKDLFIDQNNLDIVSNQREGIFENPFIESATMHSFAPILDQGKSYPFDFIYNDNYDQLGTRENYKNKPIIFDEKLDIPNIGVFNNSSGIQGIGPAINMSGFIYE
jgi:tyrosine-protein phosphatase SIW14